MSYEKLTALAMRARPSSKFMQPPSPICPPAEMISSTWGVYDGWTHVIIGSTLSIHSMTTRTREELSATFIAARINSFPVPFANTAPCSLQSPTTAALAADRHSAFIMVVFGPVQDPHETPHCSANGFAMSQSSDVPLAPRSHSFKTSASKDSSVWFTFALQKLPLKIAVKLTSEKLRGAMERSRQHGSRFPVPSWISLQIAAC
mmetsp:Transcript_4174/g.9976  ORF Transcript_4174/g.9976 Transcript_4174/m.9976 type:complete len:204 (-) Transcript_4174:1669-2280(-)